MNDDAVPQAFSVVPIASKLRSYGGIAMGRAGAGLKIFSKSV